MPSQAAADLAESTPDCLGELSAEYGMEPLIRDIALMGLKNKTELWVHKQFGTNSYIESL